MTSSIRLVLALSASVLISACSNTPYDDPTVGTGGGNTSTIPEAGPLTGGGSYTPPPSNYQPPSYVPPATQPGGNYDYGGGTNINPDPSGGYDTYNPNAGGQQGGATGGGTYDYSGGTGGGNTSYDTYTGDGSTTSSGGGNYYGGGSNTGGGGSIGSANGSAAVQIFASGSSSKAEQIRSSMASRGLNAVVDRVDGLYKVRVPFASEAEARANLGQVRSASGESGAFVTFR